MIKVTNGKVTGFVGENKIYIGRSNRNLVGSVLANPFKINSTTSRTEVITKYRAWLWNEYQKGGEVYKELHRLAKLPELELVCWCAPKACHGDVVKKCLEWIKTQSS